MTYDPEPYRISNFVTLALAGTFCSLLASHAAFEAAHESNRPDMHEWAVASRPSCCLMFVCGAAWQVCAAAQVSDRDSLEDVLQSLRCQFAVAEDCPSGLRERAFELLEHCLRMATVRARAALDEALDGFPVSDGDFPHWMEMQQWRSARS